MREDYLDKVSIQQLWMGIRRRIVFIALTTLIFAGFAFVYSAYISPSRYEARTTFILGKTKLSSYVETQTIFMDISKNLGNSYVVILNSIPIRERVINNLHLNMLPEDLSKLIKIRLIEGTDIIEVVVTDTKPDRAANIANEMIDVFRKTIEDKIPYNDIQVLEYGIAPYRPISPNILLNVLLASIVGLLLGLIVATFLEIKTMTIYSANELANNIAYPVLGYLYDKKRSLFSAKTTSKSNNKRIESLNDLRTNLKKLVAEKALKVIVITPSSNKERSFTIELAERLALIDEKILVIDCDIRKTAVRNKNASIQPGLTEILNSSFDSKYVITQNKVDLIPSGKQVIYSSELLSNPLMDELVKTLRARYDLILLETPPVSEVTDAAVLERLADGYIITCSEGIVTKEALRQSINAIEKVDGKVVGMVMNGLR